MITRLQAMSRLEIARGLARQHKQAAVTIAFDVADALLSSPGRTELEVEAAVQAERGELFCMEHRNWTNQMPELCPICELDQHLASLRSSGAPLACHVCGKPASCIGAYEGSRDYRPACDACCGHGNEDGRCWPLAEAVKQLSDGMKAAEDEIERSSGAPQETVPQETKQLEPDIAQAIAKLRSEHRAGLTPEIVAAEDALIAAVRAENASKSLVLPDGILAAAVQRIVDALRGDEGGHVLGSNHAGTCPVCRSLSDLLVLVSAGEHK